MAAPRPRVDNFAALMWAIKNILPYAVLFYAIDIFIWWNGQPPSGVPSESNNRNLIQNVVFSSLFVVGYFLINFFRARSRQKQAMMAPAQVVVLQQPIYVQAPPGYVYPPYPGQPGAPPPQQLQGPPYYAQYAPPPPPPPPAPPPQPADPRRKPPEGQA